MWEALEGTAETQIPPLGLKSSVGMTIQNQSRFAGRNKKAHRFSCGKASSNEPSASGTAQLKTPKAKSCAVPGGLGFLPHATHRSTTPTRAKAARFGGPGETVGYHLSPAAAGSGRAAVECWSSPKPQKTEPRSRGSPLRAVFARNGVVEGRKRS